MCYMVLLGVTMCYTVLQSVTACYRLLKQLSTPDISPPSNVWPTLNSIPQTDFDTLMIRTQSSVRVSVRVRVRVWVRVRVRVRVHVKPCNSM